MTRWLKTRTLVQKVLLVMGCSGLALGALLVIYPLVRHESAAGGGPPQVLDVSLISIGQPQVGSMVEVTVASGAVGGDIDAIYFRNVTLGGAWVEGDYYDPTGYARITAGVGDLLEVKVENTSETPPVDTAEVGYVPAPTDSARPDFDPSKLVGSSSFQVVIQQAAVFDQSWPVSAQLGLYGQAFADTKTLTSSNGSSNTNSVTLTMSASTNDRAVVRLTDNYGNRTEVHYVVGVSASSASYDPFPSIEDYRPEGTYADAERTGLAPIVAQGVLLPARNFIFSQNVLSLRGRALDLNVVLSYRSTMQYEGPLGRGWDWNLDARLTEYDQLEYWPGNGLVHEGLSLDPPFAPPGFFLLPDVAADYVLVDAAGSVLHFKDKLLWMIQDPSGNTLEIDRFGSGRVAQVTDDKGRVTTFSWFSSGHLAEIIDFGGRRTLFDYDDGLLVRVTRPDGSYLSWEYDSDRMRYVYEATEASGTPVVALQNTYDNDAVVEQRNRYNLDFGDPTLIAEPDTNLTWSLDSVVVTDPAGHTVEYGYAPQDPSNEAYGELRVVRRTLDDQRESAPWQSGSYPDPEWIETWFEVNAGNLLLAARYHRHADQGGSPADLEREEWVYDWADQTSSDDPRGRGLLTEHWILGDGTGTAFGSTTCYDDPSHEFWPTLHTDLNGVETITEFTASGRLLLRKIADVTPAGPSPTAYNILTTYDYVEGRLESLTNPNRHHAEGPDPEPSVVYEYHDEGTQTGWLQRVKHLDESGTAKLWTEYTYDVFGNVLSETDQSGKVTHHTYDLLDRRVTTTYEVTLTHPSTQLVEHVTTHIYEGDRLEQVDVTYYDLGLATDVTVTMQKYTETATTSTTGYEIIAERALEAGSPVVYAKEVTLHDARGLPVARRSYTSATEYTEHSTDYDALGLALKTLTDPSSASGDELVDYYAYDFAGRQTQHFSTNWDQPARTIYDAYGRPVQQISTRIVLGRPYDEDQDSYGSNLYGYFTTHTTYDDTNGKPQQVKQVRKYVLHGTAPTAPTAAGWASFPTGHQLTGEDLTTYDEAGRPVGHEQRIGSNSLALTETEYYPGGQVRRRFLPPDEDQEVHANLIVLDALDRVVSEVDETELNEQLTTYDSTGRVSVRTRRDYDEAKEDTDDYVTEYTYDERGRTIAMARVAFGEDDIVSHTHYDGLGRVVRTATTQDSATGVITAREYDLGGRLTRERRGYDLISGLYSEMLYTYDHKGRTLSHKQLVTPSGGGEYLETTYEYDGADRLVTETLPPFGGTGGTRERTILYGFAPYHGSIDLPATLTLQPNGAELTTIQNQLGHTLREVSDHETVATVAGPELLEYLYAGSSACGCSGAGKPLEIRTAHDPNAASEGDTIVRRSYDLGGRLLNDHYILCTGASPSPTWSRRPATWYGSATTTVAARRPCPTPAGRS